jgi:hypothetical protein
VSHGLLLNIFRQIIQVTSGSAHDFSNKVCNAHTNIYANCVVIYANHSKITELIKNIMQENMTDDLQ